MESSIESHHQETKDMVKTEYVEKTPSYERKTMSQRLNGIKYAVTTKDGWLGDYDYGFLCMPRIPFLAKRTNTPPFFGLNTNLPTLLAIFLGFQHCLAMVSGVVTPSLILSGSGTGNLNLPADYQQYMISSALIVTAIGSAFQITALRYRGFQLGTGLLSVVGTTFTIIPIAQSVFTNMYSTGFCPSSTAADGTVTNLACPAGYGALLGTSMICSLLPMGLSFLPPKTLKKMFPPIVTGTTVFLIGLSLVTSGFQSWGGGSGPCVARPDTGLFSVCPQEGGPNAAPWGDPRWIGLGFLVYVSIVLIEYFGSPFLKNIQVVVGFVIGIIVAAATGYIDQSQIDSAPVITFLWVKTFPISIYGPAVIPMLIVYLVSVVESVGDITASCDASRIPVEGPEFEKRIKGGILVDGINSLMAACATSTPLVTFAQNNGVIALTRCASRTAGYWCCFFLFIMGIFGKFAGVFLAVPDAVLGGMTTFLFSTVAVAGIRILSYLKWTRRERFIVSAAMTIGLGVNLVPTWFSYVLTYSGSNQALRGFLDSIDVIVSNGFCIAAIIATLLNATLPFDIDAEESEHLNIDQSSLDASFCAIQCTLGLQVANISLCPQLAARPTPPIAAYDLRPDDFSMIMALGDSVSAGFGVGGIQGQFLSASSLQEYRGLSFSIGGDPNAITIANMMRYYSHDLVGSSTGTNLITLCFQSFCPDFQYHTNDYFNAAQSGAHSSDLSHELDYLIPTVHQYIGLNQSGWKMLNVFIGSNDLCAICEGGYRSPTEYGQNILAALERVRANMNNVFVNLRKKSSPLYDFGLIHVDEIYQLTMNSTYCQPFQSSPFVVNDYECPCAHSSANKTIMAANVEFYNQALESVYLTYKAQNFPTFGVAYQPLAVDILSFPIEVISNIDCFHPALMAHQWLAKMIWNMLFVPQSQKPSKLSFNSAATVYCPTESDRIQIF